MTADAITKRFRLKPTRPGQLGIGPVDDDDELPDVLCHNMEYLQRHVTWLTQFRKTGGRREHFIFIGLERRDNYGVTLTRELLDDANELGIELALNLYGTERILVLLRS